MMYLVIYYIFLYKLSVKFKQYLLMGIGDWGLGIGD